MASRAQALQAAEEAPVQATRVHAPRSVRARAQMFAAHVHLALMSAVAAVGPPGVRLFATAAAAAPAGGTVTIAPGVEMPVVSNGYSPFTANENTTDALETWFRVGGRSVDTAFEYSNQPWVGDAVRAAVAGGPSMQSKTLSRPAPCSAHSLQRHRSSMVHAIAAVRAPKSRLLATTGGKGPEFRLPEHDALSQACRAKRSS